MELLDLPPELLAIILSFLPIKTACRLCLTCTTFREILYQDPFYQKIVTKYAPMTGLWQSLDRKYYGRLLKVSFCEITKEFIFWTLIPDPDIRNKIQISKVVSIFLKNNEVIIIDKFGLPAEVTFHAVLFTTMAYDNDCDQEDEKHLSLRSDSETYNTDDSEYSDDSDEDEDVNGDVLKIQFCSGYLSTLATSRTRYTRVLTRAWITKYHRGHVSGSPQLAALAPGIFKAVYGGHGVEFVHFQDGQGVKVTGDPDVPFNEITFRVTCGHRISFPIGIQSDSMELKEATEKHFNRYALPNVGTYKSFDLDFVIPNSFDFVIPESMHRRDEVPTTLTKCLGRWVGEAQIRSNGFFPYYTPANLLLFNHDTFAVMLLDPYVVRMYYRVNI